MLSMIDAAKLSEVMLPDVSLRLVEPHLYSPYAPGEQSNSYDHKGALSFYDRVACNRFYNRLVWGYDIVIITPCAARPSTPPRRAGYWTPAAGPGLHRQDLRRL